MVTRINSPWLQPVAAGMGATAASLMGDSLTSQFLVDTNPTASYDPSTGVLTITDAGHALATGWTVDVFNRTYTALKKHRPYTLTRIDANTYSVNVGANQPGLPNGALSGSTYSRVHTRQGSNSWVNWMQMLLGWPFEIIYNGAQSGDTTADCLDRLHEHCLSIDAEVVIMQLPGINDMSTANGPIDEETIARNQRLLIERIVNAGKFLVLGSMIPVFTGAPQAGVQNMARVTALNRRAQQLVRTLPRVLWLDLYERIVDPASTAGVAIASYLKNTDFVHYSIPGALRAGKRVRDKLQSVIVANHSTLPRSPVDCFTGSQFTATSISITGGIATVAIAGLLASNRFIAGERVHIFGATSSTEINGWDRVVLTADTSGFTFATTAADAGSVTGTVVMSRARNIDINPLGTTATGGGVTAPVTGVCMDGVNARFHAGAGTAVASVVAHPDGIGNMQRLIVSAAVANDLPGFQSEVTSTLNGFAIAGQVFSFEGELRISSANWANTPITEIMFRLIVTVDGTPFASHAINTYDGLTGVSLAEDVVLHVRTQDMPIPAGTVSQFYWIVYVRCSGNVTSNLTIDLARRNVEHRPQTL